MSEPAPRRVCRFGAFEVDCVAKEVRKHGLRLRLAGKPFELLLALLERPGEIVSREELRERLWSADTFVEFDHNLNTSINRLRETLSDSAEAPRFIETHSRRGYCFVAQVEWMGNGAPAPAEAPPPPMPTADARRRLYLKALAYVGAFAALLAVVWFARPASEPALAFPNRGWVLVTEFENRSGEAVLDGTVEYALERELSNSRFMNVVPLPRVQDTLRLMKKPMDAPLNLAVAREVAVRDGNVQLILTGRTEKIGSRYLFSVSMVSPYTGATLRTANEEADGLDGVVPALRRLSDSVRRSLGEELAPETGGRQDLEKVTTTSLHALQLYSQAMKLVNTSQWRAAVPLLREAVQDDPEFASAHIHLAHCFSRLREHDNAAPHYQAAFRLADSTPDRERYLILGIYYQWFERDYEKATAAYRTLVQLYPDHLWGANNLFDLLPGSEESMLWAEERLRLRPNDLRTHVQALDLAHRYDPSREPRLYQRLRELSGPVSPGNGWWWLFFQEKADMLGHRGDFAGVAREVQRMVEEAGRMKVGDRDVVLGYSSLMLISIGRLHEAEQANEQISFQPTRRRTRYRLAELRGDRRALREVMQTYRSWPGGELDKWWAVVGLVQLGRLAECRQYLAKEAESMSSYRPMAMGELLLAEGRPAEAIAELRPAFDSFVRYRSPWQLHETALRLARALEAQGKPQQAVEYLERALRHPSRWDYSWQEARVRLHLLQLYRRLGKSADAQRTEIDLRTKLAAADPDHPILRALNSPQGQQSAQNRPD